MSGVAEGVVRGVNVSGVVGADVCAVGEARAAVRAEGIRRTARHRRWQH